jgi:hypothetical protein
MEPPAQCPFSESTSNMLKSVILIASVVGWYGIADLTSQAMAQNANTLTQNLNNTGIPRQTPSLGLGQIYGLNPCATGATAGVTTPIFGIAGAVSNIDRECETRNNAAVVITALHDTSMAREVLCTIKDVRDAAARIGQPCLGDAPNSHEVSHAGAASTRNQDVHAEMRVPPKVNQQRAEDGGPGVLSNAPAFCRTKNLVLSLYPECAGDQTRAIARAHSAPSRTL